MPIEEKAGQLLMTYFDGEELNKDAQTLIETVHIGGIIYYTWANGLRSPSQVSELSADLQSLAKIPLLIAIDQEGGLVTRLNEGFTVFPGNKALGMTNSPEFAELAAFAMGEEMLSCGINMNLAPVVDVNSNPKNPIIGIRSFGNAPEVVSTFGKKALNGYQKAGIITSLKHFPGHGDVEIDSHLDLPILNKSIDELRTCELLPFIELADQADTVMTAHLLVPSLDPTCCATLSKPILDLLRSECHFNGVIISDSLGMGGVLKDSHAPLEEIAIRAFNAGCDILLLGGQYLNEAGELVKITIANVQKVHEALISAIQTGQISEERLDASLQKILALKKKILKTLPERCLDHSELAKQIAKSALKIVQKKPIPDLETSRIILFAPERMHRAIERAKLLQMGQKTTPLFFQSLLPSKEDLQAAEMLAKEADLLLFFSYDAWRNRAQTDLIQALLKANPPLVLIALGGPQDADLFPEADLSLTTFSPTYPALQAVYDALSSLPASK